MAEDTVNEEADNEWYSEFKSELGSIQNKSGTICEPYCHRAKEDNTKID